MTIMDRRLVRRGIVFFLLAFLLGVSGMGCSMYKRGDTVYGMIGGREFRILSENGNPLYTQRFQVERVIEAQGAVQFTTGADDNMKQEWVDEHLYPRFWRDPR